MVMLNLIGDDVALVEDYRPADRCRASGQQAGIRAGRKVGP